MQLHCFSIFSQPFRRFKTAKDTDNAVHATALLRNLPYMMETFDPNVSTTSISLSWSLRTWHSLSSLRLLFSFSDVDNEVMKASSAMTSFTHKFSNGIRYGILQGPEVRDNDPDASNCEQVLVMKCLFKTSNRKLSTT